MDTAPASDPRLSFDQPPHPATASPPGPDDAPELPRPVRRMTSGELGRMGETLAAHRLRALGWQIVARNLRLGRSGEIDVVALDGETLVFLEVKTRRSYVTGVPQAAVTPRKLARLRQLVGRYLMEHSTPHRDVRIDVIAVHAHGDDTCTVEHLRAVG